ncbi:MAG TPA: Holliday junction resolvase RuvX [Syntrophomonas sp.]|nr:Holliday junction resolvase RuvX [Syntrophomonas sp.]HCF70517.1 Holliday junction resolvase RuvX [Syntrophomonas sp.]
MRIMGLDVGDRRIGIALSDPMGWIAQGHSVLHRTSLEKDLEHLQQLCIEMEVEKLVVGFPRNMNGTVGPRARQTEEFARQLQGYTNLPLEYWDERMTTQIAEKVLIEADVSRSKRRKVIDKMAAISILQNYLDSLNKK